jgi:quinol-cytochrome oxidoreductase complex cytochrome b subunit
VSIWRWALVSRVRRLLDGLWEWLRERAGLDELPLRRVPYTHFNLGAWLGAVVAGSFALLAVTGLLLLIYYDPSNPAESNKALLEEKPFFNILLTTHLYAAHAMILSGVVHLVRNLLLRIYRRPRELQWILGVAAGFTAIQAAFFGYSLVGDTTAVEAIQIGRGLVENALGWLGKTLSALAFGSAGTDYHRVLGLHVLMAGLLGVLFLAHFGLFEAHGPFRIQRGKEEKLAPWFPVNFLYMVTLVLATWGVIVFANAISQAAGFVHRLLYPLPIFEGTELAKLVRPMPPWFLVYAYKVFQLDFLYVPIQGYSAILILVLAMVLPPLLFAALPFIDRSRDSVPLRNPAILISLYTLTLLVQLTVWGAATLGYTSKAMIAAIALSPAIVLLSGSRLALAYHMGSLSARSALARFTAFFIVALVLPMLAVLGSRASGPAAWYEAAVAELGAVLAALLVLAASRYTAVERGSSEEPQTKTSRWPPGVLPGPFLVLTAVSLVLASVAAAMLAVSGVEAAVLFKPGQHLPPLLLDPIENPAGVAALLSMLLTSASAAAYALYRSYTVDEVPYSSHSRELFLHVLAIVVAVVAFAIVF